MAIFPGQLSRLPVAILFFSLPLGSHAAQEDDVLPPPPDAQTLNPSAPFHLSLVFNQWDSGVVVPVTQRSGQFFVSRADLQRAGLPGDKFSHDEVNVSALNGVKTQYDSAGQRLLMEVPNDWLPSQAITLGKQDASFKPLSGSGALLNYDLYANHTQNSGAQASVWHELRVFSGNLSLSSTGTLRQDFSGYDAGGTEGYLRYDTTLTGTDEDAIISWSAGDVVSDALSWSNSVRMGGISIGRDFSLRPDLITYPLPAFSGEAAVPSTVDVFINGYRSGSTQLQPGPFTLTNLPYINGSGDAVLVTTDALGRQVSTTLPFYVASQLLKPGLSDGAFTLGSLRRDYGIENFSYGPAAASGSYRYGVNDFWTLESHAEGAQSLVLGGVGTLVKLGRFGVVNGAYSRSEMRGQGGQQINWGYQYNTDWFNIGTQHSHRDRGFGNLALYDSPDMYDENNQPIASLSRSTDQYSLSVNLGSYGNLGAAWIDIRSFDDEKTQLLNLSWSKNLWGNSSFYLAASHDPAQNGWSLALSLQVPFGSQDSAAFSVESTPDAGSTQRVNYNHAMPSNGGFSWNLAYAHQSDADDYQQATLGWRNNKVELQGGVYGQRDNVTQWGEMSGSLVMMDNTLLAANRINDAFMVVSTDGYRDVTVNFENQPAGTTDDDGYLLISGVSSYYPANYSINTLNLPADTRIKETERRVALRRHSGYFLTFPMEQQRAASVILQDSNGNDLPVSSQVYRALQPPAPVGYDGIVYLENLSDVNPLTVTLPDGQRCSTLLTLDKNPDRKLKTYGPLICRSGA
ncbi:fimbria/pilus outer membrane usher protein [Buttiauxella sp. WJP83]|uniref:fimbria/pilus outer membrane usher protein n=1 Tax=Buttiauxella sp. WJP83 TaxID=2986951 RepID=UPI0022DD62AA|nr:fimbria/pilus outer membrane usher protein [Buttiauxella sp. WJP83]WBM72284.1 fimbria/pilus outer membrane usher protein [Buttiauxella sp. WJP83]